MHGSKVLFFWMDRKRRIPIISSLIASRLYVQEKWRKEGKARMALFDEVPYKKASVTPPSPQGKRENRSGIGIVITQHGWQHHILKI